MGLFGDPAGESVSVILVPLFIQFFGNITLATVAAPVPFVRGIDRGRGKHCSAAFVRRFNRRVGNYCCRMSLFMSFLENFALEIAD